MALSSEKKNVDNHVLQISGCSLLASKSNTNITWLLNKQQGLDTATTLHFSLSPVL